MPPARPALVAGCVILVMVVVFMYLMVLPFWWWHDRRAKGRGKTVWVDNKQVSPATAVALGRLTVPRRAPAASNLLAVRSGQGNPVRLQLWMNPTQGEHRRRSLCVSVPSFRDPETVWTILSALSRAEHPDRVVLAVCDQLDEAAGDVPILRQLLQHPQVRSSGKLQTLVQHNLRILSMPASAARGPILARSLIEQQLYRGEDFLFMVDSHTQFAPRWDTILLNDWAAAPRQPAVLTTYAREYDRRQRDQSSFHAEPLHLSFRGFEDESNFPLWDTVEQHTVRKALGLQRGEHLPTFGFSANYALLPAEVVALVPFHKGSAFPFLFFGEEVGMAMRLFTSRVHMYTPREQAILSLYDRSYRPLFWDEVPDERQAGELLSRLHMQLILGMHPGNPNGSTGRGLLGTAHTVQQYKSMSGIDILKHDATSAARLGVPQLRQGREEGEWLLPDGERL